MHGMLTPDCDSTRLGHAGSAAACQRAGGKRYLQIEAPGVGIHVDHFPGEVQPGEQLALHGGGLNLLHVHAAPGDNGLGQGTPGAQGEGQGLSLIHS